MRAWDLGRILGRSLCDHEQRHAVNDDSGYRQQSPILWSSNLSMTNTPPNDIGTDSSLHT